jgi:hypothetical protein
MAKRRRLNITLYVNRLSFFLVLFCRFIFCRSGRALSVHPVHTQYNSRNRISTFRVTQNSTLFHPHTHLSTLPFLNFSIQTTQSPCRKVQKRPQISRRGRRGGGGGWFVTHICRVLTLVGYFGLYSVLTEGRALHPCYEIRYNWASNYRGVDFRVAGVFSTIYVSHCLQPISLALIVILIWRS